MGVIRRVHCSRRPFLKRWLNFGPTQIQLIFVSIYVWRSSKKSLFYGCNRIYRSHSVCCNVTYLEEAQNIDLQTPSSNLKVNNFQ